MREDERRSHRTCQSPCHEARNEWRLGVDDLGPEGARRAQRGGRNGNRNSVAGRCWRRRLVGRQPGDSRIVRRRRWGLVRWSRHDQQDALAGLHQPAGQRIGRDRDSREVGQVRLSEEGNAQGFRRGHRSFLSRRRHHGRARRRSRSVGPAPGPGRRARTGASPSARHPAGRPRPWWPVVRASPPPVR